MTRRYIETDFTSVVAGHRLIADLPRGSFHVGESVILRDSDDAILAPGTIEALRPGDGVMILDVKWDEMVYDANEWPGHELLEVATSPVLDAADPGELITRQALPVYVLQFRADPEWPTSPHESHDTASSRQLLPA